MARVAGTTGRYDWFEGRELKVVLSLKKSGMLAILRR